MSDGVSEHLPGCLQRTLGDVPRATLLNNLRHGDQLGRFDLCNWSCTQAGKYVSFNASPDILDVPATLAVLPVLQPFGRNALKELAVMACCAVFSALRRAMGSAPPASSFRASAWRSLATAKDTSGYFPNDICFSAFWWRYFQRQSFPQSV